MSDRVNVDDSWPLPWSDPAEPDAAKPDSPTSGVNPEQRRRPRPYPSRVGSPDFASGPPTRSSRHVKNRSRRAEVVRRSLIVATTFTLLLAATAGGLAAYAYAKYNGQITRVAVLQTNDKNIRNAVLQQNAENFLVIGSDSRAGTSRSFGQVAGARSDTTMLVHLSKDRHKATIISIPRDSWVTIPKCRGADGHVVDEHTDMFNSAYTVGGPACTIATVQKLTGIEVSHYVEINFSGFESMVSALGSVSVCSPEAVNDKGSGLVLHVGTNKLNGVQALAYVRARETLGDGSDLGRIKRQQMFLGDVLRQAMNGALLTNPSRLLSFLNAATKSITADNKTTFNDLRALASSLQGLDAKRVTFYTAPIADANYSPPGTSMTGRVLLDAAAGRRLYDSVIKDVPLTPSPVVAPSTTAARTSAAASPSPSLTPKANLNAAQQTCSL